MPHSFKDKFARAYHHFKMMGPEINRWVESDPYTISDEIDPNSGDNVVSAQLVGAPPPIIAQMLGDCLHNFRATLDHLVHALALKNKSTLTDAEATETAFPIFQTCPGFKSRGMGKIKHVSGEAQAIIKGLQPYHAGDKATSHPLWVLEKLENIDKHRRLLITVSSHQGTATAIPPDVRQDFLEWSFGHSIEQKTEIARYRCVNVDTGERVKMYCNLSIAVFVADGPAQQSPVGAVLQGIANSIERDVIPPLSKLL
jgi:hypothetical protein